jgi:hypothetical protein
MIPPSQQLLTLLAWHQSKSVSTPGSCNCTGAQLSLHAARCCVHPQGLTQIDVRLWLQLLVLR